MALEIKLGTTTKKRNSTKVPSAFSLTLPCLLKEPTSIIRPTVILKTDQTDLSRINCAYIEVLKRYYFVISIVYTTSSTVEITLEVDVLATYRTEILATKAYINRAASAYNKALADTLVHRTGESTYESTAAPVSPLSSAGSYIVTAAGVSDGSTGAAQAFVMSQSQIAAMTDKLYTMTLSIEELQKQIYNPLESLLSCIWVPIKAANLNAGVGDIKIGQFTIPASAKCKTSVSALVTIRIPLPYEMGDFRNYEPYTEYTLWLPGVGLIPLEITPSIMVKTDFLIVQMAASPMTGDVSYILKIGTTPIKAAQGNFGVNLPIAQRTWNISRWAMGLGGVAMSATAGALGLIGAGAMMAGVAGSFATTIAGATDINTTVSGTIGGFALPDDLVGNVILTARTYDLSDDPNNGLQTVGRPLCATRTLGSLHGFVRCSGAYVEAACTEEEHNMIAQYVNASANYIYGGLFIE